MLSFLLKTLNKYRDKFEKGGPLESLHPVYEATDTILFSTDEVTPVSYTHLTLPTKA